MVDAEVLVVERSCPWESDSDGKVAGWLESIATLFDAITLVVKTARPWEIDPACKMTGRLDWLERATAVAGAVMLVVDMYCI